MNKDILNKQAQHWENAFSGKQDMFGVSPSSAAIKASEIFKKEGVINILELGAGQGRDTLFFAQNGFHIKVLDYSKTAIDNIIKKAKALKLDNLITGQVYDVRNLLPIKDKKFGGCSYYGVCEHKSKNNLCAKLTPPAINKDDGSFMDNEDPMIPWVKCWSFLKEEKC